jgi:DNA-directed RNA polymerase sigma subunit (sigma70/sigma32)
MALPSSEDGLLPFSESVDFDWEEDSDSPEKRSKDDEIPSQSVEVISAYLRDIARSNLLTKEEELALAKRVAKGDMDARAKMIESNLRLVVYLAKRYINKGLPLSDLIEEGNIGLIKAVERLDYKKGFRF